MADKLSMGFDVKKVKGRIGVYEINTAGTADVPEWVMLMRRGQSRTVDGITYLVDDISVMSIMGMFERRANDVVIDYEHQAVKSDGPAPAAGWIKEVEARADGIWARVEWTAKASEYIANREYRYLSPVIWCQRDSGRVMLIHNVGLTNNPRITDYPAITNKADQADGDENMNWLDKIRGLLGLGADVSEEAASAALSKTVNTAKAAGKKLAKLAGLDDDADLEGAADAVEKLVNSSAAAIPAEVAEALGLGKEANTAQALGAIQGLTEGKAELVKLQNRVATLETSDLEKRVNSLVERGITEGKITPAGKAAALDLAKGNPDKYEAYINAAPVVVPVGKLPGGNKAGDPPDGHLDDAQKEVNSVLGITPERWAKAHGKEA